MRVRILLSVLLLSLVPPVFAAAEEGDGKGGTADRAPVRVATLLPFVDAALSEANPEVFVVASIRSSRHQPLAEGVIDLGSPHSPNLERLAVARPDLVVGDRAIHAALEEPIEGLGLELLLIDSASVSQTLASLSEVSRAVGGNAALDARIRAVSADLAELRIEERASVLTLFGAPGSFFVMTERAWLGDLVKSLGFESAITGLGDERFPGLVPVSDEVMATANPDLVLLVVHGDPSAIRSDLERRTGQGGAWASLAKARFGTHILDPELFGVNPGLELPRAAQRIVEIVALESESASR